MKKTIAILLALVFIAAGGMLFVHNWIDGLGDDVTIKETVLAGDRKAAEGVTVTTNSHYEETPLFWQTACTVGKENKVEARLDFERTRKDEWSHEDRPMLNLGYEDQMNWYNVGVEENPEDYGYPMEIFEDVIADTKPGSAHEGIVKLSDYIPYRSSYLNVNFYDEDGYVEAYVDGRDDGSYFRFPMTKYSDTKVRVEMSTSGQVSSLTVEPQHMHYLDEKTIVTEDQKTAYVAVGDMILVERDASGKQLDIRSVPLEEGTCGVHRFDITYEEDKYGHRFGDVEVKNGQLVYPLKQGTGIEKLWISADGSQLLLLTHEDGDIWFTALDSKTYEEKQRMRLFTYDSNVCDAVVVKDGTDYIAAFFDDGHAALLAKNKEAWQLEAVDRLYRGETYNYSFSEDADKVFAAAFDGNRFVLVNRSVNYAGSYFLWIYEGGKCKYAGAYESSLGDAGLQEADRTDDYVLRYTYQNGLSVSFDKQTH